MLFDLDRVLIDSRAAWRYTLEEAVASTTGERIDVRGLVDAYQYRPWFQVLSVVLGAPRDQALCESLCTEIMHRSALKKLLVHEGIGMALDSLRAARIEIGAISREPHELALKQAQSTGLDRFLTVLAATPDGEVWAANARLEQCLNFLEKPPQACALLTGDRADARAAAAIGLRVFRPGWLECEVDTPFVATPGALLEALGG